VTELSARKSFRVRLPGASRRASCHRPLSSNKFFFFGCRRQVTASEAALRANAPRLDRNHDGHAHPCAAPTVAARAPRLGACRSAASVVAHKRLRQNLGLSPALVPGTLRYGIASSDVAVRAESCVSKMADPEIVPCVPTRSRRVSPSAVVTFRNRRHGRLGWLS
jgi:hypothetical protein